jgi:hypothetical protein
MYKADVLLDSQSPDGIRLTTLEVEYPHAIHKDFMTHRMLSRNFLSFRAWPPEKVIEKAENDPFVPAVFKKRNQGMEPGEALEDQDEARQLWFDHLKHAIKTARAMLKNNISKDQINFVLQDFSWIRGIISATEWGNLLALRTAPNVRPEVRRMGIMMAKALAVSTPNSLGYDDWHAPFTDDIEKDDWEQVKKISTGRGARVSYLTHHGVRDPLADISLHDGLFTDYHMSPFEHVARPFSTFEWEAIRLLQRTTEKLRNYIPDNTIDHMNREVEFRGNFRGWHQYRKDIDFEYDFSLVT